MERAEISDQGALQTPATGGSKKVPQTTERGEQNTAREECTGDTGDQPQNMNILRKEKG